VSFVRPSWRLGGLVALLSLGVSCSKPEPQKPGRAELTFGGVTWQVLDGSWSVDGDALVGSGGRVQSKKAVADGTFDVDVEPGDAPGAEASVGFRYALTYDDPSRAEGYLLKMKDKTFNVFRGANSYFQPVLPEMKGFSPSGLLNGKREHVSIHMMGSAFRIDANGDPLLSFEDTTFARGRVELGAGGGKVRFSGVQLSP
jgi:hypothetical protein